MGALRSYAAEMTRSAALLLSLPVVAMAACSSPQHASTQPGTTPPVHNEPLQSSATSSPAPNGDSLAAQLKEALPWLKDVLAQDERARYTLDVHMD